MFCSYLKNKTLCISKHPNIGEKREREKNLCKFDKNQPNVCRL